MLPIPVPPAFRIIAHRGASAYAPENTLPAFDLAHAMGVTEVELDAQLTTDGQIALCHDSTLARYGHGPRQVETLAWSVLAQLDMGAWFSPHLFGGMRMLTLAQLFDTYGAAFVYHVEIKGAAPGLPAAVLAAIHSHGLAQQCIITSFSYAALHATRRLDASMRLGWLVRAIDHATCDQAQALGLFQLCPQANAVTVEQVAAARQVTPEVRAWGINGETVRDQAAEIRALIRRVVDAGCDGMTINWPDWVRHAAA
jgi:glycerophosphoryl diester phosphodiesterase